MTTNQSTAPTQDHEPTEQEALASALIFAGIGEARARGRAIDATTARRIAATLHLGPESHLAHFAATGTLNPRIALEEFDQVTDRELYQIPWHVALWEFFESLTMHDPGIPAAAHGQPAPMVFAQVEDPENGSVLDGLWIDTAQPEDAIERMLQKVTTEAGSANGNVTITAATGFFGMDIPPHASAFELAGYTRGIKTYGFAYAAFVRGIGQLVNDAEFGRRYHGSYDSLDEFRDLFDLDPGEDLNRSWLIYEGGGKHHVFSPLLEEDA